MFVCERNTTSGKRRKPIDSADSVLTQCGGVSFRSSVYSPVGLRGLYDMEFMEDNAAGRSAESKGRGALAGWGGEDPGGTEKNKLNNTVRRARISSMACIKIVL